MYYEINEDLARRSKENMSFSDYKSGSATAEYRRYADEAVRIGEEQKKRVDPMYHEKIDGLVDLYCRKMAEYMNRENQIGTMCPSVMISGGSNFPVRKKQKQVAAWEKNHELYNYCESILDRIRGVGTAGIRSDETDAVQKLRRKLKSLEEFQEKMKAANAALRMKDAEKAASRLAELGYSPDDISELRTPDFCGRTGYPAYVLQNNNANIRRIRERIAALEKEAQRAAETSGADPIEGDGYRLEENVEACRIQFFFDGKPDEETRAVLKANGFRWAPSQGAWQRMLNDNGRRAAEEVRKQIG